MGNVSRIMLAILPAMIAFTGMASAQQKKDPGFHKKFTENFSKKESKYFIQHREGGITEDKDFRYFPGTESLSEKNTKVMLYRIDPDGPAGAGRGPEIISRKKTYYGSYSARIRIPAACRVQPNVGSVVGYFTYNMDRKRGLSEIDWEWLLADPHIVYIGTWTGFSKSLQRVGRCINLATGQIYNTIYRSDKGGNIDHPLSGAQCQPEKVEAIEGYDASKNFYTYGFDWYPDHLAWWIIHPVTNRKIILWDYRGPTPEFSGIPDLPTYYRLNFWHTNNWAVETNPKSLERPAYPYELECDWMSYVPFDEYNREK